MIMKRLMLCILLLSSFFSMKLCAQDFVIDNLEYTILSSGDRTVGVKCANTEIDSLYIPTEVSFNGENYTVTSILSYGLCHCSALKYISLPAKLEHIENFAMMGLNQLEEIKIPNTVKSIGLGAFGACRNLKHIYVGKSVKDIKNECFDSCTSLEDTVIIHPDTKYGNNTFSFCPNIKCIIIEPGVTKIPNEMFNNYDDMIYPLIPLQVEDIVIPESVDTIGRAAFALSKLKTLKLPSCKVMGKEAFAHNRWLETVTFGNKVEHVSSSAFNGSSNPKTIYCESIIPPKEGNYVKGATLHVPKGCKEIYATTDNWAKYGENIVDDIELSGIHNSQVTIHNSDAPAYDLQGRRVTHPKQGEIYIQKGKKTRK